MAKTNDAIEIIKHRYIKNDPARQDLMREMSLNTQVSQLIYDARKRAGLTQKQLADLVQTQQSVIARLEDADYEGHSLTMLQRISDALGQKIEITMVPNLTEGGERNLNLIVGYFPIVLSNIVKTTVADLYSDRLDTIISECRCALAFSSIAYDRSYLDLYSK
jgi:transcriptional regulator with XRE-family HTH domain